MTRAILMNLVTQAILNIPGIEGIQVVDNRLIVTYRDWTGYVSMYNIDFSEHRL